MKVKLLPVVLLAFAALTYLTVPARATLIIQDDFSQPNADTGSHTPYNVYGTKMWDGAPGGGGLPPNYQTTPGHTNLGTDLPGGVWQFGSGADADYDVVEIGNLAGYGASGLYMTGGTNTIPYASLHNNEGVAITTGTYNTNATITVTVSVAPTYAGATGPAYVGFDSALNTTNNFSGLELDGTGGLTLIVSGTQVGTRIAFTGSFTGTTASQLSFTVNTTTGAISNVTLQGSTSTYNFSTSGFTAAAAQYVALFAPGGGNSKAAFANLTVQSTPNGGGGGGGGGTLIQDDFSQPNEDTGSHTPYSVYGVHMWDGASGGAGVPPNYQTTPGHTNLGTNLPGGVWQFGAGADQDYDAEEVGNLAGYGASSLYLTGGTNAIPYAVIHNNEGVAITTGTFNTNNTITITVDAATTYGGSTGPAYVGFDSALNTSNNFSGLALDGTGGLTLIVSGTQVGSRIAFTGSFTGTSARQLSFAVNTSTGAISSVSLQGSTSTYNFSTSGFTAAATHYVALFVPGGGTARAYFANLLVQYGSGGGGGSAPSITSALTATGTQNVAFSYQITASNSPTSYNATGLPGGLSVNTSSGQISGTPTATGTTNVTISATNSNGTGSATLVLKIVGGTGVSAVTANNFLNSIGVCTHITQGADAESNVATCLTYAGIRHIRDDGTTNSTTLASYVTLHNATGATVSILPADFTTADCLTEYETLAAGGALLDAEGPNEPNNQPVTYNGVTSSSTNALPTAQFMAALYTAVKGDSKLAGIPVFASSEAGGSEPTNVGLQFLTIPSGSGVTLMPIGTNYADYANTHNYILGNGMTAPVDNTPWNAEDPTLNEQWDGLYGEYGVTWNKKFSGYSNTQLMTLPRVTTETGWYTQVDAGAGNNSPVTQDQQGKLFLNLYLSAVKRGWSYTFIYYLHDTSSQGYWGLFDTSYNAKSSGTYLHNLTTILADTTAFTPGALNYSIPSEPSTVHDLLIQKSNGTFYLAVWDDRPVGEGTDNVTVNLGGTFSVNEYDPTVGTSATSLGSVSSVSLSLSDHPIILAIP